MYIPTSLLKMIRALVVILPYEKSCGFLIELDPETDRVVQTSFCERSRRISCHISNLSSTGDSFILICTYIKRLLRIVAQSHQMETTFVGVRSFRCRNGT